MKRLLAIAVVAACHHEPPPLQPLPRKAVANYLAARLSAIDGKWGDSVDALRAAAAAAPDEAMLAVALARAQAHAGKDEDARETILAARDKWPKHEQVWLASGDLYAKVSPDVAAKAYRKAIALDPTDEKAYLGLAKVHPADSGQTLHDLVVHVPTSVEGRFRLAQKLEPTMPDAAIEQLRFVLERDPDQIEARLDLSRMLRRQGKLDESIHHMRSAFDRTGQQLDIAEELFGLLCEADDVAGATDLLTLLDDDRSDLDSLALIVRLQRGLGRFDDARAVAGKIATQDAAAGAVVLAEIDVAAGDYPAALDKTLAVLPDSEAYVIARRVASEAYLASGDPQKAAAILEPLRDAHKDDVGLATPYAFALVDSGRDADARAALDAVVPGTHAADLEFARARLAERNGDVPDAIARLEKYVAAHPDEAVALNLCGYLLADSGQRLPDAQRYLERARELAPGDPAILDSWGWLLLKRGRARDAVKVLSQAARLAPREAEIELHLASAWAADGAPKTAAAVLGEAAALRAPPTVARKIAALRSKLGA